MNGPGSARFGSCLANQTPRDFIEVETESPSFSSQPLGEHRKLVSTADQDGAKGSLLRRPRLVGADRVKEGTSALLRPTLVLRGGLKVWRYGSAYEKRPIAESVADGIDRALDGSAPIAAAAKEFRRIRHLGAR